MYFCASKEINMRQVYFDNAATTQIRSEVIDAMTICLKNNYGNASSTHSFGRSSKSLIEVLIVIESELVLVLVIQRHEK